MLCCHHPLQFHRSKQRDIFLLHVAWQSIELDASLLIAAKNRLRLSVELGSQCLGLQSSLGHRQVRQYLR